MVVQVPYVDAVTPNETVIPGSNVAIEISGDNLSDASSVTLFKNGIAEQSVTISSFDYDELKDTVTAVLSIPPTADGGDRSIVVTNSAGSSTEILNESNRLTIGTAPPIGDTGDLDPSFGSGGTNSGRLAISFGDGSARFLESKNTGGNQLLVAAEVRVGNNSSLGLVRLNSAGRLDSGFGVGGVAVTDFGSTQDNIGAAAFLPDNKILAAGTILDPSGTYKICIARYLENGTPDLTFGDAGKIILPFIGGSIQITGMSLRPDGKFITIGSPVGSQPFDVGLVQFTSKGDLDASFGTNGQVADDFHQSTGSTSKMRIGVDGSITVVGSVRQFAQDPSIPFVRRYSSNGLGENWVYLPLFSYTNRFAYSLTLADDGSIFVAGTTSPVTNRRLFLTKYFSNLTLDTSFGSNGLARLPFPEADYGPRDISIVDGKILIAGTLQANGSQFMSARFDLNGNLDAAFGFGGVANVPPNNGEYSDDVAYRTHIYSNPPAAGWRGRQMYLVGDSSRASGSYITIVRMIYDQTTSPLYTPNPASSSWGYNGSGQLGDGTTSNRFSPVVVSGLENVSSVSAGASHSLALTIHGSVLAWGDNQNFQLGDGTITGRLTPAPIAGLSNISQISAGADHNIAITNTGSLIGWGKNDAGQLGDGTTINRSTPTSLNGIANVVAVAPASSHTIALRTDGTVFSWGNNASGQLGNGTTTSALSPVQVQGIENIVSIAVGTDHSLALRQDGVVFAWGNNSEGQIGDGTTTQRNLPVLVQGLSNIVSVSVGNYHSIALKSDGTVFTWGNNAYGQLGNQTRINQSVPINVGNLTDIVSIAGGAFRSTALKNDGTVWSWGLNNLGQLGNTTENIAISPSKTRQLNEQSVLATNIAGSHSLSLKPSISTPVGTNISLPINPNLSVTFSSVTSSGATTLSYQNPIGLGLTVPGGTQLLGGATSANVLSTGTTFSGPVTVCVTARRTTDLTAFNKLVLLHSEGTNWVNVTTTKDFVTKRICGHTPSLGAFTIGLTTLAPDVSVSGRVTRSSGSGITGALVVITEIGNSIPRTVKTKRDGSFRFDNVPNGRTYMVTVSHRRFVFSPPSRTFDLVDDLTNVDFLGGVGGSPSKAP